jgi:Sulfatase
MELDADIGRIMDTIRSEAPNTIVIVTADNGAWLDAYPDAGTTPFRGEKGSALSGKPAALAEGTAAGAGAYWRWWRLKATHRRGVPEHARISLS